MAGVLITLILIPALSFGQVMSGTVGLLGFGPGWYSGATRIIQATVTRAGVTEVANIALSATIRGGIAGAVIMGMVIAEPAFNSGVDAIRTWMATAGYSRMAGGGLGKAPAAGTYSPYYYPSGQSDATSLATMQTWANSQWSGVGVSLWVYTNYSNAQTAEGNAYSAAGGYYGGTYGNREFTSHSVGNISCGFEGPLNQYGVAASVTGFCGANTADGQAQPNSQPPPVPSSITDLTNKVTTDLTNGVTAATAAADEAENVLTGGVPGVLNPASTPAVQDGTGTATGTVVSTTIPATPTTGATTPAGEAANVVAGNLPAGGAITSTPPAAGTSAATPQEQPYNDPAYSGSLTTVPWATPNDFAARWTTFEGSVMGSALFGMWGNAFGSVPSGGSSTYTFNAGVFGNHTYDFSSWGSTVFGILSACVQIACGFIGVKIATLGHA